MKSITVFRAAAAALMVTVMVALFSVPAYAEEVTTEPIINEEVSAETVTEVETHVDSAKLEWIYEVIKQATPEQVELIEQVVLGGIGALDELGITGMDRVRVWVEYNMATVLTVLIIAALVGFFAATMAQKKGFAKKAEILNRNAIEMYEAGQAEAKAARTGAERYAERADKICRECAEAAKASAEEAKAAHGQVSEEREMLIHELDKCARVNAAMCETIHFLLQCSDLSQTKRDEAEAIFRRGIDALSEGEEEDRK